MKKLSREFIANRETSIKELSQARDNIYFAVEQYNKFIAGHSEEYNNLTGLLREAFESYNSSLDELSGMCQESAQNAREYYESRSAKWQDSDTGQDYSRWVDQLESVSFGDGIDEPELPDLVALEIPDMPSPEEDVELPDSEPSEL